MNRPKAPLTAVAMVLGIVLALGPAPGAAEPSSRGPSPSPPGPPLASELGSCRFPTTRAQAADPLRPLLCRPGTAALGITSGADLERLARGAGRPAPEAPAAAPGPGGPCVPLGDVNRCPDWARRHTNEGANNPVCDGIDVPQAQAVTASAVFVTGMTCTISTGLDVQTVAYDLATGEELWVQRYNGRKHLLDWPVGIAASPDGKNVYVTGAQDYRLVLKPTPDGRDAVLTAVADFVTIAYDAATGEELWVASHDGPAEGFDEGTQVAVSPDGERVYVTGSSRSDDGEFTTISYDASTGAQDWVVRHLFQSRDIPLSIAVRGTTVYAAGVGVLGASVAYEVVAIEDDREGHAGNLLWAATHDTGGIFYIANLGAMAVTPSAVVVTGISPRSANDPCTSFPDQYTTVGFDPTTGSKKWVKHYGGEGGSNLPWSLGASPDGATVYVTGTISRLNACNLSWGTVAYDAATGTEKWVSVENTPGVTEAAYALAVSPDGTRVFVTGITYYWWTVLKGDYHTAALDASSGRKLWDGRYNDSELAGVPDVDIAYLISVSPDGTRVIPSGLFAHTIQAQGDSDFYDFGTVAYEAG